MTKMGCVLWRNLVLISSLLTELSKAGMIDDSLISPDCKYDMLDAYNYIQTPKFPQSYPRNKICRWTITSTAELSRFKLSFYIFRLEDQKICDTYDFVKIYKSINTIREAVEVGPVTGYCGNHDGMLIIDVGKMLIIEFKTDSSLEFMGFNATYSVTVTEDQPAIICMGQAGDESCKRSVSVEVGSRVMLNCVARSWPMAAYTWTRILPGRMEEPIPASIVLYRFDNGSLWLRDVDKEDSALYVCQALNKYGNPKDAVNLTVHDKCRCPAVITANWYRLEPYTPTSVQSKDSTSLLQNILERAVETCCIPCNGQEQSSSIYYNYLMMKTKTINQVIDDALTAAYDISFPIYGSQDDTTFQKVVKFVPLITNPVVAIIKAKPAPEKQSTVVLNAVINQWPIFVVTLLMAVLAGMIIWVLDSRCNIEQLPRPFTKGAFEGFWWAFVTMTTVGYGDIAPKGVPGRLFAVIWALIGIVSTSVLTGLISTALTTTALGSRIVLFMAKIGAVKDSAEYSLGILKSANMTGYESYEMLLNAVASGEVTGGLIDTVVLSNLKELGAFKQVQIDRGISYNPSLKTMGVTLGAYLTTSDFDQCLAKFVEYNNQDNIKALSSISASVMSNPEISMDASVDLFSEKSFMFQIAISSVLGFIVFFSICGLIFEYCYLRPRKRRLQTVRDIELMEKPQLYLIMNRCSQFKQVLFADLSEFMKNWSKFIKTQHASFEAERVLWKAAYKLKKNKRPK